MGARTRRRVAAAAGSLALVAGLALGAPAGASARSAADRVGPGAALVTLRGGPAVPTPPVRSTRDAAVIARIRRLVDALPVSRGGGVCPDVLTAPYVLAFFHSRASAPYARVDFELGGCPRATVLDGARVVPPTLGGPRLVATFTLIRSLIEHSNPPN